MTDNLQQWVAELKNTGWSGEDWELTREGFTIVFDTSSCMELYDKHNQRVADIPVPEHADCNAVIERIDRLTKPVD